MFNTRAGGIQLGGRGPAGKGGGAHGGGAPPGAAGGGGAGGRRAGGAGGGRAGPGGGGGGAAAGRRRPARPPRRQQRDWARRVGVPLGLRGWRGWGAPGPAGLPQCFGADDGPRGIPPHPPPTHPRNPSSRASFPAEAQSGAGVFFVPPLFSYASQSKAQRAPESAAASCCSARVPHLLPGPCSPPCQRSVLRDSLLCIRSAELSAQRIHQLRLRDRRSDRDSGWGLRGWRTFFFSKCAPIVFEGGRLSDLSCRSSRPQRGSPWTRRRAGSRLSATAQPP